MFLIWTRAGTVVNTCDAWKPETASAGLRCELCRLYVLCTQKPIDVVVQPDPSQQCHVCTYMYPTGVRTAFLSVKEQDCTLVEPRFVHVYTHLYRDRLRLAAQYIKSPSRILQHSPRESLAEDNRSKTVLISQLVKYNT